MAYMVNGVTLVTDRTYNDVQELKAIIKKGLEGMTAAEKNKYLAGMKGAYNARDIMRVQGATVYLWGRLNNLPQELRNYAYIKGVTWQDEYDVPYEYPIADLNDWSETIYNIGDMMMSQDRIDMLQDILRICSVLDVSDLNYPPTMEKMTVANANAIETVLGELNNTIIILETQRKDLIDSIASI